MSKILCTVQSCLVEFQPNLCKPWWQMKPVFTPHFLRLFNSAVRRSHTAWNHVSHYNKETLLTPMHLAFSITALFSHLSHFPSVYLHLWKAQSDMSRYILAGCYLTDLNSKCILKSRWMNASPLKFHGESLREWEWDQIILKMFLIWMYACIF